MLAMLAGGLYLAIEFQRHNKAIATLERLQFAVAELGVNVGGLTREEIGRVEPAEVRANLDTIRDALQSIEHPESASAMELVSEIAGTLATIETGIPAGGQDVDARRALAARFVRLQDLEARLTLLESAIVQDARRRLDRQLGTTVAAFGVLALGFGILSVLAFSVLFRRIRGPVEALIVAAGEHERGNFDYRIPVTTDDEFARLVRAFNAMMATQQRRDDAMQEYQRGLSRSLAERTSVLDALPAHVALLDGDGTIRDVNERWRHFGRENDATDPRYGVGQNYLRICEAVEGECRAEARQVVKGIRSVLAGDQEQFTLEYPCHSPGQRRWFRVMATRLRTGASVETGEESVAGGALVTHIDITERRLAEDELREQARLMRMAGHMARFGGWQVNLGEEEVIWSEETAEIHDMPVGYRPTLEEGIRFYAEESRERIRECWHDCVENGTPWDEELEIVTARGRRIRVRTAGEPVRDAGGAIVAVQGAFQDVSELAAARERSKELARRLVETLESISDAFFVLDPQWRFTFMNPQAERMLNRHRADLIGEVVWEAFPEAVGSAFERQYRCAAETGKTVRFSEFYPPLGKWFDVSAYPTPDGVAVYFRDVTSERAREEQLRLLEAAVSRQNDILLITEAEPIDGPDGPRIVYANDAFYRRTGFAPDEVIGRTPRLLQGPKTQRVELDRIRRALARWQPVGAELINYTRSGEEIWLELDIVPLADETGWFTHWVSVERDITARKVSEEAIRVSDERFRLLSRATNDVVWDWELSSDRIWWNENLGTLFGYEPEAIGSGPEWWVRCIHPDDRERVLRGIRAIIEGGDSNWTDEYRFMHADGRARTVIDRGFVIRDESGRAMRMVGSMIDVSERRDLDERLRESQKLEAVGQLTGGVAHDFNNLLTVMLGNAEELTESLTDRAQLRALAEMIVTAARRGSELTNRLLAFARRQPLEPQAVDLNRMVAGMDGLLRRTLGENIEIETVGAGGLWLAEVDPGQLEVALLNLAINARDAMPQGGRLTIETANSRLDDDYARAHAEVVAGQYVAISVSDTGSGMTPETVDQAFEPFYTTKDVGRGSGLGLSMVYGFVKQSGGHARIYSEPGEGTTVRLYLPRAAAGEAQADRRAEPVPQQGGREHVLVVEDDALVRGHVAGQLQALGYRVTVAGNGAEALAVLGGDEEIDLLFTDVVMPGDMNGRELANEAAALRPGLKVLFTSGYTENAIVHHGRLDRGVHLLGKPYRRAELAVKIRKVLDE